MHMLHSAVLGQVPETLRRDGGRGPVLIGAGGKFRYFIVGVRAPDFRVRVTCLFWAGSLFSRNDTCHCGAIVCKTIPSVVNPP
jgi:hypothetical protein